MTVVDMLVSFPLAHVRGMSEQMQRSPELRKSNAGGVHEAD